MHMRFTLGLVLAFSCGFLLACGDDDDDGPAKPDAGRDSGVAHPGSGDAGSSANCTVKLTPGDDDRTTIQGALIDAERGDTVCLGKGSYELDGQLTLAAEGVTLRGEDGTVLDFSGQTSGANGFEISADDVTLENVRIQDPKGDGVRATEVDHVTIRGVHVEWSGGASTDNPGYGIYPVSSSNVLIENCYAAGASDTGIYVGQSSNIVIRNNEVTENVAGIEIENSTDAEVYGNKAHGNTGGILLFNLPGLRVKDGKRANVHDNVVTENNHENFSPPGNIIHDLPQGTGMFVLCSDENEIHDNEIRGHKSIGVSILSWYVALRDEEGMKDPDFDWYPERNSVHDNTFADNGDDPQGNALSIGGIVGVDKFPDMSWDGIIDSDKLDADGGMPDTGTGDPLVPPESLRNCFKDNGTAGFINFDLEHYGMNKSTDVGPYACERAALAPIKL